MAIFVVWSDSFIDHQNWYKIVTFTKRWYSVHTTMAQRLHNVGSIFTIVCTMFSQCCCNIVKRLQINFVTKMGQRSYNVRHNYVTMLPQRWNLSWIDEMWYFLTLPLLIILLCFCWQCRYWYQPAFLVKKYHHPPSNKAAAYQKQGRWSLFLSCISRLTHYLLASDCSLNLIQDGRIYDHDQSVYNKHWCLECLPGESTLTIWSLLIECLCCLVGYIVLALVGAKYVAEDDKHMTAKRTGLASLENVRAPSSQRYILLVRTKAISIFIYLSNFIWIRDKHYWIAR